MPKRSLVSLILFAVYIAGVYDEVESQVPGVRGLSFVDDVTWLAVGVTVGGLVEKLETCARMSEWWTRDNAVRFETSKTEAPPSSPIPSALVTNANISPFQYPWERPQRGAPNPT